MCRRPRCWGEPPVAAGFAADYGGCRSSIAGSVDLGAHASAPAPDRLGVVVGAATTRNGVRGRGEYGSGGGRWACRSSMAPTISPSAAGTRPCDFSGRRDGGLCTDVRALRHLAIRHAYRDHERGRHGRTVGFLTLAKPGHRPRSTARPQASPGGTPQRRIWERRGAGTGRLSLFTWLAG